MSRKIICICTESTRPTRYVTTTHNRPDKSIAAELSDNKNQAHDFATMDNAERIIARLFNPWERTYVAREIEVSQPERIGDHQTDWN